MCVYPTNILTRSVPHNAIILRPLVSPKAKGWAGAGVGIGMMWGGGIPLSANKTNNQMLKFLQLKMKHTIQIIKFMYLKYNNAIQLSRS